MVWRIGLFASLFVTLSTVTFCRAAFADSTYRPNRVTAIEPNVELGKLTFRTSQQSIITAPQIHFLAGNNGETLLLADFPNLFCPFPPQSIKPSKQNLLSSSPGISGINFGQFQSQPLIFRIAVSAKSASTLKEISFTADSGQLVMSWSRAKPLPKSEVPAPAPTKNPGEPIKTTYTDQVRKTAATKSTEPKEQLKLVFSTAQYEDASQMDSVDPNETPPSVPSGLTTSNKMPAPAPPIEMTAGLTENATQAAPPTIQIEKSQNTMALSGTQAPGPTIKVRISNKQRLAPSCFRLHEPERYVVDFDNLPLLGEAELPEVEGGTPFKAMRVGSPEGKPTVSRLVFDLSSKDCFVHSELVNSASQLVLTFSKTGTTALAHRLPGGTHVILDPGHGGSDPGARREGIQEKELTIAIVNALKERLEARGVKVTLTRSDDTYVSLEDRVKLTNSLTPNLFLSVHINSLDSNSDIHGIETYYQTGQSKPFADTVHDCLVNNLEAPDRYVRKARFYVINHTAVPAVLAEVGFISCKEERERLISFDYQDRIARALEQGVILYLVKQNQLAHAGAQAGNTESRQSY